MALADDEFVTLDPMYLNFISTDRELLEFMNSRSRLSSHSAPIVAALAQATGSIAIVDPFTADFLALSSRNVCKPIHQEINYEVALVGRRDPSLPARFLAETLETVIRNWPAPI
ncbi:type 2 periplasmic-binding domain-containing protein [Mesorhizobium sp. A556]